LASLAKAAKRPKVGAEKQDAPPPTPQNPEKRLWAIHPAVNQERAFMIPFVDLKAEHQSVQPELDAAIASVFEKSSFINGEHCKAFEKELAASVGTKFAVGASSCTSAAALTYQALGFGPGDEIITTCHTAIATAESITFRGAEVRFVDIGQDTPLMDPAEVEKAVNPRTRAIVPVHLYGIPCDMDAILDIARRHNLLVFEDCAQAQGAKYKGKTVGTMGKAAFYSFFPSKNLGCAGDGGAMCTDDSDLATRVKMLSDHGRLEKFVHEVESGNYRLDGLQAAMLRVKLPRLDAWNANRRKAAKLYFELLADVPGLKLPYNPPECECVWHVFAVQVEDRQAVAAELKKRGIGTGVHYPMSLNVQPAYKRLGLGHGSMPHAESMCAHTLSLPIFSQIIEAQVREVCAAVREVMA
jgi:dTDP-4-amino-4,6-dideoxygalactose transaminase